MEFVENGTIKLVSGDNESFELPTSAAKLSKVISEQIEEDMTDQEFPVPNINAKTLFEVVKFLNHYQEEPMTKITKPLKTSDISSLVQPWYFDFIKGDPDHPFDLEFISEILLAANFMSIEPLLELSGAAFASQVREKNVEELKTLFQFEGELIPVDEKKIREENPWALEAPLP